jgi:hypothetical protein
MKRTLVALVLVCLPCTALAGKQEQREREVLYKKVTELGFEEAEVFGSLTGPGIELIGEPKRPAFNPLIVLRTEFNDAMRHSVAATSGAHVGAASWQADGSNR